MVDFTVAEDVRLTVDAVKEFLTREVDPVHEQLGPMLHDEVRALQPDGRLKPEMLDAIKRVRRKSAEQGFYGMHMPQEVGGAGLNKAGMYEVIRTISRHGYGLNLFVFSGVEGPQQVHMHLGEDQRERWLKPLMRAEQSTCFALTEPGAGSDVGAITTRAEKKGREYVLNGTKTFITNAPYADNAIVFAKTSPEKGLQGISAFIVETDRPGFSCASIQQSLVGDGMQGELVMEDVRLPEANRIGDEDYGFYYAIENIADTRVTIGAMCVGLAEYCLDKTVEYVKQREAFGKPIGSRQALQWMLADAATEIYAADKMAQHCTWKIDRGEEVIRESSMVKLYATEMLFRVADAAVQCHGGMGAMRELPYERIQRFARVARIFEGTSEIQRWTIAKTLGL